MLKTRLFLAQKEIGYLQDSLPIENLSNEARYWLAELKFDIEMAMVNLLEGGEIDVVEGIKDRDTDMNKECDS